MSERLFESAQLAEAAYADLQRGETFAQRESLVRADLALAQAEEFALRYPTVVAFHDDLKAEESPTGFQVVVFKDSAETDTPGNLTVAFRGSRLPEDLSTGADLVLAGTAYDQIVAMVNWWNRASASPGTSVEQFRLVELPYTQISAGAVVLRAGANPDTYLVLDLAESKPAFTVEEGNLSAALARDPDGRVEVTGHSLGGHLGMAFSTIFASRTASATVFNAPGFWDTATNRAFFEKLGGSIPPLNATNITNVAADEALTDSWPFNFFAGMHSRPGQWVNIAIENQWNSDEPAPFGALNHSIATLTDSLAVYNLLAGLDPSLREPNSASQTKYKTILNLAAQSASPMRSTASSARTGCSPTT